MATDTPLPVPHPYTIQRYRGFAWILTLLGISAQVAGGVAAFAGIMSHHVGASSTGDSTLGAALLLGGMALIMAGCACFAKAKGRSALWGLWGLLALLSWIGWIILPIIFTRLEDRSGGDPSATDPGDPP